MDGQSALLELAISGNFISNDTIVIQPMNGTLAPAGKIILKDFLGGWEEKNRWEKEVSNVQRNNLFVVPGVFWGLYYPAM